MGRKCTQSNTKMAKDRETITREEFINFFKIDEQIPERQVIKNRIMENKTMKNNTKTNNVKAGAKAKVEAVQIEGGFKVLNNVPMPEPTSREGKKSAFRITVENMKVGQCFDTDSIPKHRYALEKKLNVKLVTKQLGEGKFRVWRSK